jgi:hypothetical protein
MSIFAGNLPLNQNIDKLMSNIWSARIESQWVIKHSAVHNFDKIALPKRSTTGDSTKRQLKI